MKPLSSLVVTAVFAIGLVSCGGGGDGDTDDGGGGTPPAANVAPVISAFSATPSNIRTNESVLFEWTIADDDLTALTCALDVDGDNTADYNLANCEATGNTSHTFETSGSYVATILVTDAGGLTATASTVVAVSPASSNVPVIDNLSVSESSVLAGTPVTITWSISSTESVALTCELDAQGDGTADYEFDPCPLAGSQSHTYTAAGDANPRLTVVTADGASATESAAITIQTDDSPLDINRVPVVSAFDAAPGAVMIDQAVTLSWEISDPDGDSLSCDIDVNGDGTSEITIDGCSTGQSVVHFYLTPGRFEPVLTVRDPEGLEAQLDAAVTVLPLQVDLAVAETVVAGERVRYEFTISNVSLVPVTGVELVFRVPASVSFSPRDGAVPNARGCFTCADGAEASWSFASIPAGASQSIIIDALVADSNASGAEISNRIAVTADAFTQTISAEATIRVENQPSAELAVTALQDPVQAGERLTVHVDIGNVSTGNLGDVVVRSRLPREIIVDTISDGGQLDEVSGEVVWNLSQLAVLNTRRLSMELLIPATAVPGQILAISSTIEQSGAMQPIAGMTDIITVADQRSPLQFDISMSNAPIPAGGRANYHITVSNVGLVPVTDVDIALLVPAGISFSPSADAEPNARSCFTCVQGALASWSFQSMQAGASQTITINASVLESLQAGSLVEALFYVYASNVSNVITHRSVIGIDNDPDSRITLSASADPVIAGQEITVSINTGNVSSTNLENAIVMLEVPVGVTVGSISGSGAQAGDDGMISWPAQPLPVLSSLVYSATLTVPGDAVAGEILSFRSSLEHDGGMVVDALAEQVVTVVASQPALRLEIVPADQTVSGGGRLSYEFSITNDALIPVQNISVLYRVPSGVSFSPSADADPDASNCFTCNAGAEAIWSFPSIQSGETVTISVNTNVSDQLQSGSLIDTVIEVRADGLNDTIHLSNVVAVN